jgi:hypothetical protein
VCLFTIPYGLILPVAVCWLAIRHYRSDAPSERSRRAVAILSGGATVAMLAWPPAAVPAALLLVGVGVYAVLYKEVTSRPND